MLVSAARLFRIVQARARLFVNDAVRQCSQKRQIPIGQEKAVQSGRPRSSSFMGNLDSPAEES
jgi:hypothetical protein